MFPFFKKRKGNNSGAVVRREGDALVYDEVHSGSSSTSSDEERGDPNATGAFPTDLPPVPPPHPSDEATEPSATETAQGQAENEPMPTPQEAVLLEAWMNKRREMRFEEEQQKIRAMMMDPRTGGFKRAAAGNYPQFTPQQSGGGETTNLQWFVHHPVDVDTGVEIIDTEKEHDYNVSAYIPTATATIVGEDSHTVVSRPDSMASYPSKAMSDMTPVVSNKKFETTARQRPSLAPSLSSAPEAPVGGDGGDDQAESSEDTSPGGCGKQCRAFLDFRTYHGKLALLLLVVLVLAVTTMVVSALLARQSRSIIDNPGPPTTIVTRTPTPQDSTFAPTMQPSIATGVPSPAPSTLPPVTTIQPTLLTSAVPTASPTRLLPTLAPTVDLFENLVLVEGDSVLSDENSFGASVALSGDGQVLVVGAPEAERRQGRVEIFVLVDNQWVTRDAVTGINNQGELGTSVAVSQEGLIVALSEPGFAGRTGRVTVYNYNPASGAYVTLGEPIVGGVGNSYSGTSIALSADGFRLAIGAPYYSGVDGLQMHGQVRVYEFIGNEWTPMGSPINGGGTLDWLGFAVDLSDDGLKLVASAPQNADLDGYVRTWQWNPSLMDWERWGSGDIFNDVVPALSSDRFGQVLALSSTPKGIYRIAIGIPQKRVNGDRDAGMAVVYELDSQSNEWVPIGGPIIQDPPSARVELGSSIDLLDGSTLLLGLPGEAQVNLYRFNETASTWELHPTPLQGDDSRDEFGSAVAGHDNNGLSLVVAALGQYVRHFFEV